MIQSICAAVAVTLSPTPAIPADRWEEASRYDTLIPLFPLMQSAATIEREEIVLPPATAVTISNWHSFTRGTSAGFDLLTLGDSAESNPPGVHLVRELRRLSGLTWEKAAELADVSPRTLHNWVAGQAIAEKNLRRLAEIVAVLRYMDRGYGEANRGILMTTSAGGSTLFALLAAGEYDLVKEKAGPGDGRPESPPPLSIDGMRLWGPDHFGAALSSSEGEQEDEILPLTTLGKRSAKARRKG
jgi:transcriptional regulator with XRE-family HTH domain